MYKIVCAYGVILISLRSEMQRVKVEEKVKSLLKVFRIILYLGETLVSPSYLLKIDRIPRRQLLSLELRYLAMSVDLNTVAPRLSRIACDRRVHANERKIKEEEAAEARKTEALTRKRVMDDSRKALWILKQNVKLQKLVLYFGRSYDR